MREKKVFHSIMPPAYGLLALPLKKGAGMDRKS